MDHPHRFGDQTEEELAESLRVEYSPLLNLDEALGMIARHKMSRFDVEAWIDCCRKARTRPDVRDAPRYCLHFMSRYPNPRGRIAWYSRRSTSEKVETPASKDRTLNGEPGYSRSFVPKPDDPEAIPFEDWTGRDDALRKFAPKRLKERAREEKRKSSDPDRG
jgi:hypothetical protein